MKMISRVALALALLAATVGTTTLQADTFDRVAPHLVASGDPTIRVMNNHGRSVMVYVVDYKNHRHLLGRVGRSELKDLQIPSRLVWGTRRVQLKVYPVQPSLGLGETTLLGLGDPTAFSFEPAGIKTREFFSIQSDQVIVLNLEADLTRSLAGIVSS